MTQDHTVEVRDTSDLRKYRTEIPNIIDEILINPYHFRVYCKLKRIAGQNGKCWSGNNELADLCGMGLTQYKKSKKFLSEPFEELGGRPLIVITNSKLSNGTNAHSVIEIVDIWEDNFTYMIEKYKNNKEIGGRSPHDLGSVTTRPTSVTTRPQKKEPNKKKPIKKERESLISFGEFVCLTQKQYDNFVSQEGKTFINDVIDDINNYVESYGVSYKKFTGAMRTFIKKRKIWNEEKKQKSSNDISKNEIDRRWHKAKEAIRELGEKGIEPTELGMREIKTGVVAPYNSPHYPNFLKKIKFEHLLK